MTYSRSRRLYRSRNGKIFGVCQGIADWRDLNVEYVRLFFIIGAFIAFGATIVLYFILGLALPMEPANGRRRGDREDIREDYEDLKDRVNRMEKEKQDKEQDWDRRFFDGKS